MDLEFLLIREARGNDVSPDAVPKVLELCLTEIEGRGLTEQGICKRLSARCRALETYFPSDRVAGATSEVNTLRDALNNGWSHS